MGIVVLNLNPTRSPLVKWSNVWFHAKRKSQETRNEGTSSSRMKRNVTTKSHTLVQSLAKRSRRKELLQQIALSCTKAWASPLKVAFEVKRFCYGNETPLKRFTYHKCVCVYVCVTKWGFTNAGNTSFAYIYVISNYTCICIYRASRDKFMWQIISSTLFEELATDSFLTII